MKKNNIAFLIIAIMLIGFSYAQKELNTYQTALAQSNTELAECQKKLNSSEAQLAKCQQELMQSNTELAECQKKLNSSEAQLAKCQQELMQSNEKLTEFQKKLEGSNELPPSEDTVKSIPPENMEEYLYTLLNIGTLENYYLIASSEYATEDLLKSVACAAVAFESLDTAIAVESNPNTTEAVMKCLTMSAYSGFYEIIAESEKSSKDLLEYVLGYAQYHNDIAMIKTIYSNPKWNSHT